jgi:hypothetical protein
MAVSLKENNWFFVTDQTPRPYQTRSLPAQLWHWCREWSTVWVSTKPLISEENWPVQGLNPGLPNDTPALYPLLHMLELTLSFVHKNARFDEFWAKSRFMKGKRRHVVDFSNPLLDQGCQIFLGRTYQNHINLRSRTSMLAQVLQIFCGKEQLVKIVNCKL